MQPKVSIVIPCYNKVHLISGMFNSILAQMWDNIEVIIVNDGSTDGTREIIAEYELKFKERGFEVVIVDQENKGVSASVYEGLKLATGEFLCQVDADDRLDTRYISTMIGWLLEHPDYDWAVCDAIHINSNGAEKLVSTFPLGIMPSKIVERFVLRKFRREIWRYLIRTDYFMRCGALENFYTGRSGYQEPQIFLPLIFGKGKLGYVQIPLYFYRRPKTEDHISYKDTNNIDSITKFIEQAHIPYDYVINHLPIDENEKRQILTICNFGNMKKIIHLARDNPNFEMHKLAKEYVDMVRSCFSPVPCIDSNDIFALIIAVENNILRQDRFQINVNSLPNRIIAWGAMGESGKNLLPKLQGTFLEPTELWDIAGDGVKIKKPDVNSVTKNDAVLILPISNAANAIYGELRDSNCMILLSNEIESCLKYPQFYDGSLNFLHSLQCANLT